MRVTHETGAAVVAPAGLEGVVVAETEIGDVRGAEGFFHYRGYPALELAAARSLEDVWCLLVDGELPGRAESAEFAERSAALRDLPPALARLLPEVARRGPTLDVLRSAVSLLGAELGWRPTHDLAAAELREQSLELCALVPTVLASAFRTRQGLGPVEVRHDLGLAGNYLWMLRGAEAPAEEVRAVEQYLILTLDHGLNASTFTARVAGSTGADLAACVCAALGALSGPLHGGAPSRALAMLDRIGTPERTEAVVREAVLNGERIMGFGHRVYKGDDPRSLFLRDVARGLGGDLVGFAERVERSVVEVLRELKPGRGLHANVEFYAGVVMERCGIARELFTPTFACSRAIGWTAHVAEQVAHNRLIRPSARYTGPPAPLPVPAA
ncbi:MAG TPA: citrate/2-methylcitrate synthase [Acidimicrobiales bacterium]|nr:citrate/2-methylcitrate synthase [Acidimicrobiales bacterium]